MGGCHGCNATGHNVPIGNPQCDSIANSAMAGFYFYDYDDSVSHTISIMLRTYALESPGSGRSYGNCNGWRVNRVTRRYGDMMSCDRCAKRLRRGYSDHMKVLSWTFIYFITSLHRMIKLPTDSIMFKYAMPHVIHLASLPT